MKKNHLVNKRMIIDIPDNSTIEYLQFKNYMEESEKDNMKVWDNLPTESVLNAEGLKKGCESAINFVKGLTQDKYYTPTIEEFYVGFEYEYEDIVYKYDLEKVKDNTYKTLNNEVINNGWKKEIYK